ncbi:MAG: tetratricopeptide repeat protein [Gammaproteobacteria bacterium]
MADGEKTFASGGARQRLRWLYLISAAAAVLVLAFAYFDDGKRLGKPAAGQPDKLLGFTPTAGAAPGYLDDKACATCHAGLYATYQSVGMARSFARPRAGNRIENLEAPPFYHPKSQRYYTMRPVGEAMVFMRYQLDDDGNPINVFEHRVDWILGSGNKTRSYLYQTDSGELFQLPIGWYSEKGGWDMSPGYDKSGHEGVLRPVRRECLFCHNAYPEVEAGSDGHWQPHRFPETLPEGTGCQRCHGPGAEHVRTVLRGEPLEAIRAAVVNPARLPPDRRDEVCFQCHLLPAVALIGVRRMDRSDYSFRPGQALSDYLLHVDIDERGKLREDRFEINHHAYRLRQSACFQKSASNLTCINCHDPHRKPPAAERAARYKSVCLGCHESHPPKPEASETAAGDCTACHMPQRRTRDVVQVTMTDHKIQRLAAPESERLAPREEESHRISKVEFLQPDRAPSGAEGEAYRIVTLLRARADAYLVDRLERLLAGGKIDQPRFYFDLAGGQIKLKRFESAERTLEILLEKFPDHPKATEWMGIARIGQGRLDRAEEMLQRALDKKPWSAEFHFNLGLLKTGQDDYAEAAEHFGRALALRSNMTPAWYYLAETSDRLGRPEEAAEQYRRALKIDPGHTRAYLGLSRVLLKRGERTEALRYLKHGLKAATAPEPIAKALAELQD